MYHSTVRVHYGRQSRIKTFNKLLSAVKSNLRNSNDYDSVLIEINDDDINSVVYYLLKIEALNIICCARTIEELTDNFETIKSTNSLKSLRSKDLKYDLIKTGDNIIVCIKDELDNTIQITTNKLTKIISASIFENGKMRKIDHLDLNSYNRFDSITILNEASEMIATIQKEINK